jgi:type I restriction enzyme S subunit
VKLPAYPRYKASGVEWLGDVPEHWAVKRLRRVLAEFLQYGANESAELDDPDLPRYVRITDVHQNGTLRADTFRSLPKDVATPYLLEDGDLLFARSGATSGKTFLYQSSWGVCAYAGYLIRARMNQQKAVPAFVKYFTTSKNYWQWLSSIFIQSTIQNVSAEKYADLQLSLPLPTEQRAIVAFIDRETGRLDRLVAKKRKLIERMKEKRTVLISRAVKCGLPRAAARAAGLSENLTLKLSGVEWLGEIAHHWTVSPVKFLVSTPVTDGPHETPEILDEGIPFVSAEAISNRRINFDKIRGHIAVDDHKRFSRKYKPKRGDIYLVKSGATTGRVAMVETDLEFNIWSPLAAIRCNPRLAERRFMFYYMQSKEFQTAIELSWSYGTQQNIGMGVIQNLAVPIPPLPEQSAIAAYLDAETVKLDTLVQKVEEAIERLQEYRTALITAAVTGKIDVRKAAA